MQWSLMKFSSYKNKLQIISLLFTNWQPDSHKGVLFFGNNNYNLFQQNMEGEGKKEERNQEVSNN